MPDTTIERLLRRARRRLFAVTMALLVLLVAGIGATTAGVALGALNADVDRALIDSVRARAALASLDRDGDGSPPSGDASADPDRPTGESDTFVLVLDTSGRVVENRSKYPLEGLPDMAAVARAGSAGSDLRSVTAGDVALRLYTVPFSHHDKVRGFVQGGMRLDLRDQISRTLAVTIAAVGALGLLGAALVTLVVTGRALRPIREVFEAQRRFVADASHELRTPAALIRANAEVLQREGLVADGGRDLAADLVAEADRLGLLVGDMLQLAAWGETRLAVTLAPVDVAALSEHLVRGAAALAADRGVALEHEAPGPVLAQADRDRLVQLLPILVDNAVDHSPQGGTVWVRARHAGQAVTLEVADQGPGIPPEARERIFEPFARLHGAPRHGSGGTGLGLAIARRIADAMGGTIRVGTAAGGGAAFTVTLPAARTPASPPSTGPGGGRA